MITLSIGVIDTERETTPSVHVTHIALALAGQKKKQKQTPKNHSL